MLRCWELDALDRTWSRSQKITPAEATLWAARQLSGLKQRDGGEAPIMVAISLLPSRGNGARWFPHSGHLGTTIAAAATALTHPGLSPVKLEGVVRTQLEDDGKPVQATALSVAVRCYEARNGRLGAVRTHVLVEQAATLWTAEDGAALGALERAFRIVLPVDTAGSSTFHLQDYRVYWRIEAGESHADGRRVLIPAAIHLVGGSRQTRAFDVNLVRYNKPKTPQPPPGRWLQVPRHAVAPLAPIPVAVSIHAVRASFALERRIEFMHPTPDSSATHLPSPSSTTALLPSPPRSPHKSLDAVLATADADSSLAAVLQLPAPKSGAHWGVGETMHGDLARIRFFIYLKDSVHSCQEEITVVPIGDAERLCVHSKYAMKRPATCPSAIENRQRPHLPSPPPSPNHLAVPRPKAPKRPHTSLGTRDQRRALPLRPHSRGNTAPPSFDQCAWERDLHTPPPRPSSALWLFRKRSPSPPTDSFVARTVAVPSIRTPDVLEWEAEVERFSSASAREAVLNGRRPTSL
ncbi:hypothetical protein CTheo_5819 [Ceratobasidium theobromae]|uniref:Uncharacterized protein n=1 Tax=Ceratobasidium theobromae TaxID=1582974 RepID=A0A5N5QGX9_9AGAM|nr:hypothetical protein CTheo_5819 [Ceratobasidium theobromae]